MPECKYCDASFEDEAAYLEHLYDEHDESELSRIDRRRVAAHVGEEEDGEFPTGPVIIAGTLLFTVAVLVYVVFFLNTGGSRPAAAGSVGDVARTPYGAGTVHHHGPIDVVIDGQRVNFSRPRYQRLDQAFHFERGNGERWHTHAKGVTLEYALSTLGIGVTDTSVTYMGTTYREGDANRTVTVAVDGRDVDPSSYVLQEDDHISVRVRAD